MRTNLNTSANGEKNQKEDNKKFNERNKRVNISHVHHISCYA